MSALNDVKKWLVASWRTLSQHQRIAFIVLPLLLFISTVVLVKTLSSAASTNRASAAEYAAEASLPQSLQARVAKHAASVMTLQRWLLRGRSTQEEAGIALTMLQQLQIIEDAPENDSNWQDYSAELERLESGIEKRVISTPEAIALVKILRSEYTALRSRSEPLVTLQQATANKTGVSDASVRSNWLYALLPLLLLSLGTLAWLFYASTRPRQTRMNPLLRTVDSRANQSAILQLLDEMEPLADGDLRVEATVSEAMTGALADAFNYAVNELRWLVGAIKGSAAQVTESVNNTRESAESLAQASAVQAREIHRSSNYLSVMSDTMAQLSAHAAESSRIAVDSVKQAQVGTHAVDASVKGLVNIREQAHMTSRLMERLVESSDSIKKHVNDIQRVAKNTDLLALNTTIRAAAASGGDQTNELSRLSAEVSQLAATLKQATRDIGSLAAVIQQDAALTLTSMKKTNRELDAGHQKAIQASHSLQAIEQVSHDMQNQINDMASKTLRQAGVVRQLSANMGVINGITRDSAVGLEDAAGELEELQLMANALLQSVAGFTLPESETDYVSAVKPVAVQRVEAAVDVDHRSQALDGSPSQTVPTEADR